MSNQDTVDGLREAALSVANGANIVKFAQEIMPKIIKLASAQGLDASEAAAAMAICVGSYCGALREEVGRAELVELGAAMEYVRIMLRKHLSGLGQ